MAVGEVGGLVGIALILPGKTAVLGSGALLGAWPVVVELVRLCRLVAMILLILARAMRAQARVMMSPATAASWRAESIDTKLLNIKIWVVDWVQNCCPLLCVALASTVTEADQTACDEYTKKGENSRELRLHREVCGAVLSERLKNLC